MDSVFELDTASMITENQPIPVESSAKSPAWYCLRTQPKHEHIAASHLQRRIENMDVFNPQLRIRRQTRRGAVWFVEALFPGYLLARFDSSNFMQIVRRTPGITTVVSFGIITPSIPDGVVDELRAQFDANNPQEIGDDVRVGDDITIASGPFHGLNANVLRVMPAAGRVQVLLEILGRTTPVEIAREQVMTQKSVPQLLATKQSGICND